MYRTVKMGSELNEISSIAITRKKRVICNINTIVFLSLTLFKSVHCSKSHLIKTINYQYHEYDT